MTTQPAHHEEMHDRRVFLPGRLLREAGYPVRALPFILRAVRLEPDNDEAWAELQATSDQIHQLFDVVSHCKRVLAEDPANCRVLLALARALTRLDCDKEAATVLERALAVGPQDRDAFLNLGHLLVNNNHLESALVVFDRLIALDPECGDAWVNKGMVLCKLRRYVDALPILDRALELDQTDGFSWTEQVLALYGLYREEEARAVHRRERAARRRRAAIDAT